MSKSISKSDGYSNPKIERLLKKFEISAIEGMRIRGLHDAEYGRCDNEADWRIAVFNPLNTAGQTVIDEIMMELQPASRNNAKKIVVEDSEISKHFIGRRILNAEIKEVSLNSEVCSLRPDTSENVKRSLVSIANWSVACFDGYLTFESLVGYGIPILPATFAALVCGFTIGLGAIFHSDIVMQSTKKGVIVFRIVAGLIVAAGIFYLLGDARSDLYNYRSDFVTNGTEVATNSHDGMVSGWVLMMLSMFLYIAALFFKCMVWQSKDERELQSKYRNKLKELKGVKKEINSLTNSLADIDTTKQKKIENLTKQTEYAIGAIKKVVATATQGLAEYSDAYRQHNTARKVPLYMVTPPKFEFIINNNPINN